jgi:hypothetical protein
MNDRFRPLEFNTRPLRLMPAEEIELEQIAQDIRVAVSLISSHCNICEKYHTIEDWDGFQSAAERLFATVTDLRKLTKNLKPILESSANHYRKLQSERNNKQGRPGKEVAQQK